MEILSSEQIRAWDQFTMQSEPISSIDLMERAASKCLEWLIENGFLHKSFTIFCGKGNNGGDGLALARLLSQKESTVVVYILEFGYKGTDDFQANLARLHETKVEIHFIQTIENFHPTRSGDIIIDALYGSGLNRPLEGVTQKLVEFINRSGNKIISIDLPSGLFSDKSSNGNPVIQATHTLSFQCYKLAFLLPENGPYCGIVQILDIGLNRKFLGHIENNYTLLDIAFIKTIFKPRDQYANKGDFGHALLLAGAYGKMGAAVLASKACLRSGVGLLTIHIPKKGYEIIQVSIPEAMVSIDSDENINTLLPEQLLEYSAIGIGPGIGIAKKTTVMLSNLLNQYKKPIVIDADALNIISANQELLEQLPPYSILTPHPKEFERLFGPGGNDFERLALAIQKSNQYQIIIVLKGHYTFIAIPGGKGYFNSTGNAGMAKGGSGDALTGMVTSFLAQGYSSGESSILSVYLHGLAGDYAATVFSQYGMLASDLINCLGDAVLTLG
jgi:ADP-dependent NAD(P)H-hydrate dehydratase / NAD(P)H-hydrate epimerase